MPTAPTRLLSRQSVAIARGGRLLKGRIAVRNSATPNYGLQSLFSGATVQTNRMTYATINAYVSDIRLCYANWWAHQATGEAPNPDPITITAAIEYGGVSYPVYFRDGARSVALAGGATIESLPVGIEIPPGTTFYIRTCVTVSANAVKVPGGGLQAALLTDGFTAGSDTTLSTGNMASSALNAGWLIYSPFGITARTPAASTIKQVVIVGDSIAAGTFDIPLNRGYIRAGLGTGFGILNCGTPAETGDKWNTSHAFRGAVLDGADYVIDQYGFNDVNGNVTITLATLQSRAIARWLGISVRDPKVYATTITPATSSTDNWATTVNQTISHNAAQIAARTGFNTWMRGGAPVVPVTLAAAAVGAVGSIVAGASGHPLTGVFDPALIAETTINSGIWKVGYVDGAGGGGIHPNAAGCVALGASINPAMLV